MNEILLRVLWIVAIICFASYLFYLFFGTMVKKDADAMEQRVVANDIVSQGEHHISGVITVPSPCHGLFLRVLQTTPFSYHLAFETWQEPYRDCPLEPSPREFHIVTFAPSIGATFYATLDGKPFPLQLLERYEKKQP